MENPKDDEIPKGQDILAFLLLLGMFLASGGCDEDEDEE